MCWCWRAGGGWALASHSALDPAGCTERKTIIITIWKASVQPVPAPPHTPTHTLPLAHSSVCSAGVYAEWCRIYSGASLESPPCWRTSASIPHLSSTAAFSQTNNSAPVTASFKWMRKTNKHNATEIFGRVATDDLNPVSLLMGASATVRQQANLENCTKAVILKPRFAQTWRAKRNPKIALALETHERKHIRLWTSASFGQRVFPIWKRRGKNNLTGDRN